MLLRYHLLFCLLFVLLSQACKQDQHLFVLKSEDTASFRNDLTYTEEFNPYTYRNFYNGGGVAMGDINNDGLLDIYFTGNLVDNKMFLNKGNWEFEDITASSGLACPNVWSSGANFVDVNGDGWLDLYVCKAGKPEGENRHNELFINKGSESAGLQFEERSVEYGLDVKGLSIQSAFFDYDHDGDLDCYLLNNSLRSIGGLNLVKDKRKEYSENGNKFFENRDGRFYDVTQESGIFSSEIGFGLGITLSDFNLDGWTDIYISNDFFEKDYLYINNQDKTFTEQGEKYFQCFPLGSMGADVADLDNDLLPDLMITEMLPNTVNRKKTKAIYESWKKYSLATSKGYSHQFPRNMLQRNMGDAGFLEIGRKAGIEGTNWSWSCLMQDFDNDGLKDIIVANGIYKDLLDRDYLAFMANDTKVKSSLKKGNNDAITSLIDAMPSEAISNFAFKNIGDFNFENQSDNWGLGKASFSNGCAYGDLDNDGDLDLVFNNVNMSSFLFENTANEQGGSYLKIDLKGKNANTRAIGAKVIIYACDQTFMSEQYPSRGFQSSVSNQILLGLGSCNNVDSLKIIWPDGHYDLHTDVQVNSTIQLEEKEQGKNIAAFNTESSISIFKLEETLGLIHQQPNFNQFNRERLLMKMNTVEGPALAIADLNNDQVLDVFMGGGKGQVSNLQFSGLDSKNDITSFESGKRSEVTEALFFDCDNDGDQDVYIANGGTAFSPQAAELQDELYINDGKGQLSKKDKAFSFLKPVATGAVAISDYNKDGLLDVFVGERNGNNTYGLPGSGYLFKNKGQQEFELVNSPQFENLGIITDAKWLDVNNDELPDLMVVGEWMPITVFINTGDDFEKQELGLENTNGLWNKILVHDFNDDGEEDIFVGNIGQNSALDTNHKLYLYDFDSNGSVEQILAEEVDGEIYPSLDMDELMSQLPFLKKKYVFYKDYSEATMEQLFDPQTLEKCTVLNLDVLESQLYFKRNGRFEKQTLPEELQFSSIHAAIAHDFDHDGKKDLLVGGNHYLTKPQFGRDDASKAWIVFGKEKEGTIKFEEVESLNISGQIRDFELLDERRILVGSINQAVKVYSF